MWTVVGLVVFSMLGLSLLVLGGLTVEANVLAGVNEALRTAAALGVFVLALLAYRKWRRPEDARRRADAAQEILRLGRRLEGRTQRTAK